MLSFTEAITSFYGLWLSLFHGLPYGDPYLAWAVLVAIMGILGWALKLVFEKEGDDFTPH